jgi:hypothetical protein
MMSRRPNFPTAALDQTLQVLDPADVRLNADRLIAKRSDLALERLRGCGICDVIDDDARSRLREADGDRLSDPAVPAGDNRNFVLQRHRISL